jgi:RNA polymerase sigma factor (sigma-70 family)
MDERGDAVLVALARAGDKAAFGLLIERYHPMARRVATGVVADGEVARELAQEAMLQAFLSLERLRDPERFQSWLYGIVLNVCRSYLRDRDTSFLSLEALAGGLRFEAVSLAGIEPDPQEVAEAQELHRTVLGAVESLSPRNRAATLLFYYDQLSVREIAATLGASVAAVKVRLHRSREHLRELLLPVYSETSRPIQQDEEVKKMVKVTIADIAPREGKDPTTGESTRLHVVILLDREGGRVLPIWIGPSEGEAIAMGLKDYPVPRPLTHGFLANVIDAIGATVEEVRVEALREDTFYAVVKLCSGKTVRELDARPSDALALAVLTGSPIYVAEEVIEKAGIKLDEKVGEEQPLRKGLFAVQDLLKDLDEREAKWVPMTAEEKREALAQRKERQAEWSRMTEEERQQARAKIAHEQPKGVFDYLFGGEGEESEA